jgi:4-hydroxyphenylpyruvate dioxygenase
MEQLGADTVLVCSSVSPDAVDDDDLAAEQLHALAARAGERGLRVAYEALAWGRVVSTYEHSWRIVRRAAHPALGLCLDSFHVLSRGSDPALIRTIPAEKLLYVQLADAPRLGMDVLQWSRHHRLFPGQGAFDLTSFVGAVLAAGYPGPLSLEVFNDVFRQADPQRAAVDAMRSLLSLQERLGQVALPDAPALNGHAFTEIEADQAAGARVANALACLGFVHSGEHRSKPVQLWRQGEARVLVNTTDRGEGASVSAIAVESADPPGSARRAQRLLAPVLPRSHRADEADLSAVAAPDGTSVFFCRTDARDADSWLGDFRLLDADSAGAGITGLDHIALTQPFDRYDEAALFYRAVLGLEPEDTTEFAAPFGLMRSRMIADRGRRVRIEWAPGVREPQHIALATGDALASARTMRSLGAPLLEIPGNYYDDLDARLAPDPALLAGLREESVLYDRDEHGELLHFFTEVLGGRSSSRSSSGSVTTRATARRTPRFGWPPNAGSGWRGRSAEFADLDVHLVLDLQLDREAVRAAERDGPRELRGGDLAGDQPIDGGVAAVEPDRLGHVEDEARHVVGLRWSAGDNRAGHQPHGQHVVVVRSLGDLVRQVHPAAAPEAQVAELAIRRRPRGGVELAEPHDGAHVYGHVGGDRRATALEVPAHQRAGDRRPHRVATVRVELGDGEGRRVECVDAARAFPVGAQRAQGGVVELHLEQHLVVVRVHEHRQVRHVQHLVAEQQHAVAPGGVGSAVLVVFSMRVHLGPPLSPVLLVSAYGRAPGGFDTDGSRTVRRRWCRRSLPGSGRRARCAGRTRGSGAASPVAATRRCPVSDGGR